MKSFQEAIRGGREREREREREEAHIEQERLRSG